ncbi:hypothetical protein FGB62_184g06 [Gracilaria domingensis]|nr:hypothetical protein FGB62_184g06 [Gracilaria domingensis]
MAEMRSRRNGARRAERPVAGTGTAGWGGKGMETSSAEAARRQGGAGDAVPERNGWHGGVEWCTLVPLRRPPVARREGGAALRRTLRAKTRTCTCMHLARAERRAVRRV